MRKNKDMEIDIDALLEIRDVLKYGIEDRSWAEVEDAVDLINDLLGVADDSDSDDEKHSHLEE